LLKMSTLLQISKSHRKKRSNQSAKFVANPQQKVFCLRLTTMTPKKPNSANRRIAKVNSTTTNKGFSVKIPGENHNLQQHSTILVRAGSIRDLIGVSSIALRGKFDLFGVKNRKSSRSVYGLKAT